MSKTISRRIWFFISVPVLFSILLIIAYVAWGYGGYRPIIVSQLKHKDHPIYQGNATDGGIDYLKSVEMEFKRDVTDENNFAITILETLSSEWSQVTVKERNKYANELKFNSPAKHPLYSAKELQSLCQLKVGATIYSRPLNPDSIMFEEDVAALRSMLEKQSPALDYILQELPLRPRYYYPYLRDENNIHFYGGISHQTREIARWFKVRSTINLLDGNPETAWRDIRGMFQMAHRVSQGLNYFEHMVAAFLQQMAIDQTVKVLNSPNLQPELLDQIAAEMPALLQINNASKAIDFGERATMSHLMDQVIARGRWNEFNQGVNSEKLPTPEPGWVNTRQAMDAINELLDVLRDQLESTDYLNALQQSDAAIEELRLKSQLETSWIKSPTGEATKKAIRGLFNSTMGTNPIRYQLQLIGEQRMIRLAIAIRQFEQTQQRLPETSEELADLTDAENFYDPIDDQAWDWTLDEAGLHLWGAGPNGKDDRPRRVQTPQIAIDDLEITIVRH